MRLFPYFKGRNGGARLQPGPDWQVAACRWSAASAGCHSAILRAALRRVNPAELLDLLGCPLELVDSGGATAWWGYVESVRPAWGRCGAEASLARLANRVRVIYGEVSALQRGGGTRLATTWQDDPASQAVYGIKERQFQLALASQAQAEAYRAALLADLSRPRLRPLLAGDAPPDGQLELRAVGWFETLNWRAYSACAGLVEYTLEGVGVQPVGEVSANTRLAQSFTCGDGGWRGEEIWLNVRKSGAPGDQLQVQLCADSGGAPGTALGAAALAGASLSTDFRWTKWSLVAPLQLAAGAAYWVVVSRSGGLDASNAYRLRVNEGLGFSGGVLRLYNGSGWAARSPDADLLFRFAGNAETSAQIAAAAAPGAGGQFLAGVRLDAASGIFTNPYRAGDRTAWEEINAHLKAGQAGGAGLLAWVSPERYLVVSARPDESTASYQIDRRGVIRGQAGVEVEAHQAARLVGQWAGMDALWQGVAPALVSERICLEQLTWQAEDGLVRAAAE